MSDYYPNPAFVAVVFVALGFLWHLGGAAGVAAWEKIENAWRRWRG